MRVMETACKRPGMETVGNGNGGINTEVAYRRHVYKKPRVKLEVTRRPTPTYTVTLRG